MGNMREMLAESKCNANKIKEKEEENKEEEEEAKEEELR